MVPLPRSGQLPHLVQAEHLLHTGQRRKFFGRNFSQLRFGKSPVQRVNHEAPARLQQCQGVQGQRIEEAAADVGRPGVEVGHDPNTVTFAGRRNHDPKHIAK